MLDELNESTLNHNYNLIGIAAQKRVRIIMKMKRLDLFRRNNARGLSGKCISQMGPYPAFLILL